MHLEHVQLQGFKSFVQRTEVALCPHFTCVTGPNGSGKSNILDAICFALTEGDLANLRVRSMTELVSTDASVDKASVVLTFVGAGSGSEKTRLQATCRKKDGAREFKLDGVKKAVRDVRMFLKARGLDVEGSSNILYQNTVMGLSDKSGAQLAAMVMAASGGAIFDSLIETVNRNVDKSESEKRATEGKIAAFQKDMAADSEQLMLVAARDELKNKIAAQAGAIAVCELVAVHCENMGIEQRAAGLRATREGVQRRLQEHSSSADVSAAEQQLEKDLLKATRKHSRGTKALNEHREAMAEQAEEETGLQAQLDERREEREETKRTLDALVKSKLLLSVRQLEAFDEISRNDTELQRLDGLLQVPDSAADTAAQIASLQSSLSAQQSQHDSCTKKRQQAQTQSQQLAAEQGRCEAEQARRMEQIERLRASGLESSGGDDQLDMSNRLAQVETAIETVRHEIQVSSAKNKGTKGRSKSSNQPLMRQLQFTSSQSEQYLDALNEIAGSKLQAVVVKDVTAGERLLKQGKGKVIWPLDRLQPNISPDEEQRVATVVLECQGEAILPSSTLSFTGVPSAVPFRRCFGGWAISKTPRATEHLVRKGIKTCELDGTKHMPGVMSGGFLGGERNNHVRTEFEFQKAAEVAEALGARAAELESESETLKRRLQSNTDLTAATEEQSELATQLSECKAKSAACADQLGELDREQRLASQQIEMLSAELKNRTDHDQATVRNGLEESSSQLKQQNDNLRGELSRLGTDLQQADEDEKQLKASIHVQHQQEADADDPNDATQREIAQQQGKRQSLQQAAAKLQADVDSSAAACGELQQEIEEGRAQAAEADQQLQSFTQQLQQCDSGLASAADRLKELAATRKQLVKSERIHEDQQKEAEAQAAKQLSAPETEAAADTSELRVEVKVWQQKLEEVLSELSEFPGADGADTSALAAKQNQLSEFTTKRHTIDSAITKLSTEILASQQKKNAANLKAFTAIAQSFGEFFALLVPSKEAQLRSGNANANTSDMNIDDDPAATHFEAIEEVHFAVRTRGTDGEGVAWKTSTVELSGGQRTLLGLAFVLAIAKYQPSPVYILDEVDAALDEGNQAKVAQLVSQVLGHEQRCQTIAISHHADFQRGAARVTEIGKKQGGSCVVNSIDRVPG